MKTIKKSSKAYGLKSTIAYNDDVYMTSFGKGNEFIMEKLIYPDDRIENLTDKPTLNVNVLNQDITLKYKKNEINVNNPVKNTNQDYLMLKSKLEKDYYGKEFNDNIHIQIIYNIMDIKKILSLYYYNIVYALNNLNRDNTNQDLIGTLYYKASYNEFLEDKKEVFNNFYNNVKYRLAYFGNAFKYDDSRNDDIKIYNFNVFRLLSLLRQFIAHTNNRNDNLLYLNEDEIERLPELKDIIDKSFNSDIQNVRKSFSSNSAKNLIIISKILNIDLNKKEEKEKIFKEYYDFAILKNQKNIGLNITKLREAYYSKGYLSGIYDHKHDTYRTKINTVIDFIFYRYIHIEKNENENDIVDELRKSMNDEEKNSIYLKYAKRIRSEIIKKSNEFENVINLVRNEIRKKNSINFKNELNKISSISGYSFFSKYIYFITKFLDGKEINELLTSLINKFENIQSFNEILKNKLNDLDCDTQYELFNGDNPGKLANELKICKSIARMKPENEQKKTKEKENKSNKNNPSNSANESKEDKALSNIKEERKSIKVPLFKDALNILNIGDKEFDEETLEFLNREKGDHKLRNFIINNIINSSRFMYVVKYMTPSKCVKFIKNEELVRFVLSTIPDSQIDRYYKTITGKKNNNRENQIREIITLLKNLDFNQIKENEKNMKERNNPEVEKLKALVGLYLTIIYLLTKSLVKINSIYILAFSCFERDYRNVFNDNRKPNQIFNDEMRLVSYYKDENRFKGKNLYFINTNIEEYAKLNENNIEIFRNFRNITLHLNLISNAYKYIDDIRAIKSYYDIYQYILQNWIFNDLGSSNEMIEDFKAKFNRYHTYVNDLVKIMNIPFAYNLARYKNLVIADIFNDKFLKKDENESENNN